MLIGYHATNMSSTSYGVGPAHNPMNVTENLTRRRSREPVEWGAFEGTFAYV